MAKVSAKNAVITLNSNDVSTYVKTYEINWAVATEEITGFKDGWQNHLAGMPIVGFTLDMMWDSTVFGYLTTLMGTPATCSIQPQGADSGQVLSGTFFCSGIHPSGEASSGASIKFGTVEFLASGATIATFAATA